MRRVLDSVPSLSWLARQLNRTKQSVSKWDRIPEDYLLDVEAITGIPRHLIRPDLYGPNPLLASKDHHHAAK